MGVYQYERDAVARQGEVKFLPRRPLPTHGPTNISPFWGVLRRRIVHV
jgi:hypothetical protein